MAFKASNIVPQDAYAILKRGAVQLKVNLQGINSRLAASNADYAFLQDIYLTLKRYQTQATTLAATPGIVAYAKDQEDDQTYDVVAEFNTMTATITSALGWLDANVPTNVTAKAPADWDGGVIISNEFTPAQTSVLRTRLTAVINTIS
jgi:hypothetical protein